MTTGLAPGTPVVLDDGEGDLTLVQVPGPEETVEVPGLGVLAGGLFESASLGGRLSLGRRKVLILPVTPQLAFETLERGAQVIRPQDAARIAHGCAVGPGRTVVEGGVGSGALTAYLAFLVGERGDVHGFDVRADHLGTARRNLERLAMADRVAWHEQDLGEADVPCDAFIVDVPEPAEVLPAAQRCLRPGGRLAIYSPLTSQVETAREALEAHAFAQIETVEQLDRRWIVHERGARPDFEMLGHTGFITFATRVLDDDPT